LIACAREEPIRPMPISATLPKTGLESIVMRASP
jgi:hypothetical protein